MQFRNFALGLIFAGFALFAASCVPPELLQDPRNMTQELRTTDDFNAIRLCCGMRLELTQGDETRVELEGNERTLTNVDTFVRNNTLIIEFKRSSMFFSPRRNGQVTAYITVPTLRALELSGGSRGVADLIQSDDLNLELSGGSNMEIETLTAEELEVDLSGGAQISIDDGSITNQTISASGGSQYLLEDVQSITADLDLSGGSRARISVSESLRVDASGGSTLAYHGRPQVDQDSSGGSQIRSLGQ